MTRSPIAPRARRRAAIRAALVAAALSALGCEQRGTIAIELATAPDSTLLDQVTSARLRLSEPPAIAEAIRTEDGLSLALDVAAEGQAGAVTFEGFDADGDLIAYGHSGRLIANAVDATLTIYVAAPLSLAPAPNAPDPPRSDAALVPLSYGAMLAGGRTATGTAATEIERYSVYQHRFEPVADLTGGRIAPAAATGVRDNIYLFGGIDSAGVDTDTLARVVPSGGGAAVIDIAAADSGLARSGAAMAALGGDRFAVTGNPAVLIDNSSTGARRYADAPALAGTATSTVIAGQRYTVFAGAGNGASGAIVLTDERFSELPPTPVDGAPAGLARTAHSAAALPDGNVLVVAGRVTQADGGDALASAGLRVWPDLGRVENVLRLATPRADAAAAATDAYLVVAGGVDADGALVADAEIFALPGPGQPDFTAVATVPMVAARSGAQAAPLPNGQVLIVGGVDADGAPVVQAELFTPAPAEPPLAPATAR